MKLSSFKAAGLIIALWCLLATSAWATSTINPNNPAQNSPLSSAVLRANFLAGYNDINGIQASTVPYGVSNPGLVPETGGLGSTYFLSANGSWLVPAGGGGSGLNQLTGDILAGPGTGSQVATLPTINANTGVYGSSSAVAQVNLNAKGQVVGASSIAISPSAIGAAALASPTFTGTVTLPANQVVNGVTLTSSGAAEQFLSQAGTYLPPGMDTCADTTGSTTAYICTSANGQATTNGKAFLFKPQATNTGSSTLTINGVIWTLKKQGSNLAAGDFIGGQWYVVASDGVFWDVVSRVGSDGGGGGGAVSSVFGRVGSVVATSGDYGVAQITGAAPTVSPTFTGTVNGASDTWTATSTSLNFVATGTSANSLPAGTTAQRPGSPANSMIRYNSDGSGSFEGYINGVWQTIVSSATGLVNLATGVTGVTPIANGGTNSAVGNLYYNYGAPLIEASALHTYGDSITAGFTVTGTTDYPYYLSTDMGAGLSNLGHSGDQACDMAWRLISGENPGQTKNALITTMIGTNDFGVKGVGAYEAVYKKCHQAALAWAAVPSNNKIFGQSCTQTTGTWNTPSGGDGSFINAHAVYSATNGNVLTCPITTTGGPIYIWFGTGDTFTTTFTYTIDGGSPVAVNSFSTPTVSTQNGEAVGQFLIRVPGISAGAHNVVFTQTSTGGDVLITAVGTPPANSYWEGPTVFDGGVPKQASDANSAGTAAYNADAIADVNLLAGDGLRVYSAPVRNYVLTASDYNDSLHFNASGHQHARDAFAGAMEFVPYFSAGSNGVSFPTDTTTGASIAIGGNALVTQSGLTPTAFGNTVFGYQAMSSTSMTVAAIDDTMVGFDAGQNLTSGQDNTFVGWKAGYFGTSGYYNTFVGSKTGGYPNYASYIVAVGYSAGGQNGDTVLGYQANGNGTGVAVGYNTEAAGGTVVGYSAGHAQSGSGQANTLIGGSAGILITSGTGNTTLGDGVGSTVLTTGTNNILIGTSNATTTAAAATAHQLNLENTITGTLKAGTNPSICAVGMPCRLGHLTAANLNVTTDQAITIGPLTSGNINFLSAATKYIITSIEVGNCSASTTTAQGGFYTAASKGGTILGATTTAFTNCASATTRQRLTGLTNMDSNILTAATIYLSLTTAQGGADTADIDIYGIPYN